MTLLDAEINRAYKILGLSCDQKLKRRLLDMGFTEGSDINVVGIAPFGGTILVALRGCTVGLRNDAAKAIMLGGSI